jgi:transposase InsO family protein
MKIVGARRPGSKNISRVREISRLAKQRLKWMDHYAAHGNAALTCRYFGISRQTFYRWKGRYNSRDLRSLEERSHRPRRLRKPTWSRELALAVLHLREQYPRWGREKLRVLLPEEGITISAKSIDRVIGRLKARGVLREAVQPRKVVRWQHKRLRRPKELVVDSPGALVQMDSKHVALGNGKVVYQFGAVDYFTRKRVVALAPRLTSHNGAEFLRQVVTQFPFQVQAIQSDGGSEFLKEFGAAIAELQLTHYFNRPNYPQGNGRIERSFRTDEEEFYQVEDLPADLGGLQQALLAWNRTYETVRPHQALGYKTPDQFYHHWLDTNTKGKEALSDIS